MSHGFEGEESSEILSRELGISVEDVDAYVTMESNEGTDGHPFGYIANFAPSTPAHIREAAGAGDGFTVRLDLNVFDEPE